MNDRLTRIKTFIKAKLNRAVVHTNVEKYKVAVNITEYHMLSRLIFFRVIILKSMMIRQLFYLKYVYIIMSKTTFFK